MSNVPKVALMCFVVAFFVQLKAIEYKPQPGLYPACSITAWVIFLLGMVLWFVPVAQ